MAYRQWGNPSSPKLVLCVHGLTRQGRDFDVLAQALVTAAQGDVRVVCPDVAGRGDSDWLVDPAGYQVPLYAADMLALLVQLHAAHPIQTFDYVGTSMGGLIGMVLAGHRGLALPTSIRKLVLNDVGPTIESAAVARIAAYVGSGGPYESLQSAADALWELSSSFGPHTPAQWLALSQAMVVPASLRSADGLTKRDGASEDVAASSSTGRWRLHYDPAIGMPLRALTAAAVAQGEAVMWSLFDAISARTLVIRGAESDLLSHATALEMTARGPKARLVEFSGVGHAPTFVDPAQSAVVADFLAAD